MYFVPREKLTILSLSQKRSTITFDEMIPLLSERPAGKIYVEAAGKIYGIISTARIKRAHAVGKRAIEVNTSYLSIREKNVMKARKTILEKEIQDLPVVNDSGILVGAFSKSDDLLYRDRKPEFFDHPYARDFFKENHNIAFVKANDLSEASWKTMLKWKSVLESGYGVDAVIIEGKEIEEAVKTKSLSLILLATQDQLDGLHNLYMCLMGQDFEQVAPEKWRTISSLSYEIGKNIIRNALLNMQEQGVHVFTLNFSETTGYLRDFEAKIKAKFARLGVERQTHIPDEAKEDFFGELYNDEYKKQFFAISYKAELYGNALAVRDTASPLFHASNGVRHTTEQPRHYIRQVYTFGPCLIIGSYVEDKHTIASWLQRFINLDKIPCLVQNMGVHAPSELELNKIFSTPMSEGDVALVFMENWTFQGIPNINLTEALETDDIPANWVWDAVCHGNYKVNESYARLIYQTIEPLLRQPLQDKKDIVPACSSLSYIIKYFMDFDPQKHKTIGSIVMNCNPFTKGHRFLIEEALKRVDFLIIFVVQEDLSLFSFEERFAMVCDGVADLKNVKVVPSGDLILSKLTFPEYFVKVVDDDIGQNTERDITAFAEQIAVKLNISYRFVGEEKEDATTNEYNSAMKRILPQYDINVVEIPRKTIDGEIVSGTLARRCMEQNDMGHLKNLVPASTIRIAFQELK